MSVRELRRQGLTLVVAAILLNLGWAAYGFDESALPTDLTLVSMAGNLFILYVMYRLRTGRQVATPAATDRISPEPVPDSIRDTAPLVRTIDDFPQPVLILDAQRPFYVNRAFLTLLELAPTDLDESNFVFSRVLARLRHAVEDGAEERRDVEPFRTVTGGAKTLYLEATTFPLGEGSPLTAAVLTDVTRRHIDNQRRKEMELEVIRQASMSSLGRMALGMAEHVSRPLTTILKEAEQGAEREPEGSGYQTIHRQAEAIAAILEDLADKGRHDVSREAELLDLGALLRSEMRLLSAHCAVASDARIETSIDDDLPRVRGLYSDFSLTIEALLTNAVEAMETGDDRRLHVSARGTEDDVLIEITDSGRGVSRRDLPRIFDPFFSTKSDSAGRLSGARHAGLGLTTARHLLSRYGARIEVHSTPDRGSTFRVRIPHRTADDARPIEPQPAAETNLSGVYLY